MFFVDVFRLFDDDSYNRFSFENAFTAMIFAKALATAKYCYCSVVYDKNNNVLFTFYSDTN